MLSFSTSVAGHHSISDSQNGYSGRLDIVPFEAWHVRYLVLREEQRAVSVELTPVYAQQLEHAGHCFSAWAGSQVVACAGIVVFWPGRAQVWSLMGASVERYGSCIHRHVKRYIDRFSIARLECVVDPQFTVSVKWAMRLGFVFESRMRAYGTHKQDMDMYVRLARG